MKGLEGSIGKRTYWQHRSMNNKMSYRVVVGFNYLEKHNK